MNKLFKSIAICAVIATTVFTACKKDEDSTTTTKSKEEYITTGSWKITAATVSPGIPFGGTIITDWYSQLPACEKDNTRSYKTDGKYIDDEGASKCDAADPQTEQGTYLWNSDKTVITETDASGDKTEYKVVSVDASTLKLSYTFENDGVTYTITTTATH